MISACSYSHHQPQINSQCSRERLELRSLPPLMICSCACLSCRHLTQWQKKSFHICVWSWRKNIQAVWRGNQSRRGVWRSMVIQKYIYLSDMINNVNNKAELHYWLKADIFHSFQTFWMIVKLDLIKNGYIFKLKYLYYISICR